MILTPENIRQIAERSSLETTACSCIRSLSQGWETLPKTLEASSLLRFIGEIPTDRAQELSLEEYHPNGTHFWSEDAPICFDFFPYNISSVWGCKCCARAFLRFTEAGAYHSEQRIRILRASLIGNPVQEEHVQD
ncbi:hypothetical protein [Pseudomonas sp.]|uniref:hypothetical protein n=1 Tax=unclassified Pseudomonas TaxID=196821 RepID=UPI00199528F9|nr:hypothetical protein [Pseudomonas sp.]MBC6622591.1 hypothetical protein [Pseudomonas sp.]MBP6956930.1 hypothetical protein [Pseudomonas sp.]